MGTEFNTRWSLSYDYKTQLAILRPTAAVEYDRVMVNSYDEAGAGALDLNVAYQTSESLRSELGGKLTREYTAIGKNWIPYVSAAWQHEYENQSEAHQRPALFRWKRVLDRHAGCRDGIRRSSERARSLNGPKPSLSSLTTSERWEGRTSTAHNFDGGVRFRF